MHLCNILASDVCTAAGDEMRWTAGLVVWAAVMDSGIRQGKSEGRCRDDSSRALLREIRDEPRVRTVMEFSNPSVCVDRQQANLMGSVNSAGCSCRSVMASGICTE